MCRRYVRYFRFRTCRLLLLLMLAFLDRKYKDIIGKPIQDVADWTVPRFVFSAYYWLYYLPNSLDSLHLERRSRRCGWCNTPITGADASKECRTADCSRKLCADSGCCNAWGLLREQATCADCFHKLDFDAPSSTSSFNLSVKFQVIPPACVGYQLPASLVPYTTYYKKPTDSVAATGQSQTYLTGLVDPSEEKVGDESSVPQVSRSGRPINSPKRYQQ